MGFEAGYLPVALREGGGTYRITFRVEILARKFKNGREIRKMGQKFNKMGAKIQKSQKKCRHYVANTFFSGEGPFYLVLVPSDHEGGIEGS